MFPILVTLDVSHVDMSALNLPFLSKSPFMLVTALVSQAEMCPYFASACRGSLHHALTASLMSASLRMSLGSKALDGARCVEEEEEEEEEEEQGSIAAEAGGAEGAGDVEEAGAARAVAVAAEARDPSRAFTFASSSSRFSLSSCNDLSCRESFS